MSNFLKLPSAGMAESSVGIQTPFTHPHCLWWDSPVPWSEIFLFLKAEFTLVLFLWLGMISFGWVAVTLQATPILLSFLWTLNFSFAKIFPQIWDVFCWVRVLSALTVLGAGGASGALGFSVVYTHNYWPAAHKCEEELKGLHLCLTVWVFSVHQNEVPLWELVMLGYRLLENPNLCRLAVYPLIVILMKTALLWETTLLTTLFQYCVIPSSVLTFTCWGVWKVFCCGVVVRQEAFRWNSKWFFTFHRTLLGGVEGLKGSKCIFNCPIFTF